jgi:MFS family permease
MMNQQFRSLRWLDVLIFVLADVQGGVGPFLAIYLQASRHWDAASVGIALSITSIAAPLAQIPAGALVDQSHHKRALIAGASLLIGLSSACVVLIPGKLGIYMTQCVIGITSAIFIPAIAAISLGIVGTERLDRRIARNESLNHAGNVINAGVMGLLGYALSRNWIFFFVVFLCCFSLLFFFAH